MTPTQVFPCVNCKIFKNTYFEEYQRAAVSSMCYVFYISISITRTYVSGADLEIWLSNKTPEQCFTFEVSTIYVYKFVNSKRLTLYNDFVRNQTRIQGVSLLRSKTWRVFLLVLWFDTTNTAHSSSLYYIEWIICWYQKFTLQRSTMSLLFKNYWLEEVIHLLIRFSKTKFFK